MNILVTGGSGFVGQHLIQLLLAVEPQNRLFAVASTTQPSLQHPQLEWLIGDLADAQFTNQVIATAQPDQVFHLAALSSAGASFAQPAKTIAANSVMQANLLQSIKDSAFRPRIIISGSIEQYGLVDQQHPVTEDSPFRPLNPYAVSKIAQDYLGMQYHLSAQMDVVVLRPSNHIGPGQSAAFAVPSFAKQIAQIEAGQQLPLMKVGNLQVVRDFTDVRDMVVAYQVAADRAESGQAYVIGSGKGTLLAELVEQLVGLSAVSIEIQQDPALVRPAENSKIIVDATKFRNQTEWSPAINLESTLRDILDYWRNRIKE